MADRSAISRRSRQNLTPASGRAPRSGLSAASVMSAHLALPTPCAASAQMLSGAWIAGHAGCKSEASCTKGHRLSRARAGNISRPVCTLLANVVGDRPGKLRSLAGSGRSRCYVHLLSRTTHHCPIELVQGFLVPSIESRNCPDSPLVRVTELRSLRGYIRQDRS